MSRTEVDPIDRRALLAAIADLPAYEDNSGPPWDIAIYDPSGVRIADVRRAIDTAPALLADDLGAATEQRLNRALRENQCGDLECEERRIVAAVRVLTGGDGHLQYAVLVEEPEPVPCPLCPHWMHLHEADGSCGGGCH